MRIRGIAAIAWLLSAILFAEAVPLTSAPAAGAADLNELWAWGFNNGDGPVRPVLVNGLSGVTSLSGGRGFALTLQSDGTVFGWGNNSAGQLGDGSQTNRPTPVQASA